jgi:uncharacterized lipoprotein YmbA
MKPEQHVQRRAFQIVPLLIAAAWLSVFTGCMSSAGKKYYQLFLPLTPDAAAGENSAVPAPRFDKVLMIVPVDIEDIYNDYRVVYRTSPYQLNYYSYHFWIKKPDKLVRDAIRDYLSANRVFKGVITDFAGLDPDLLLKAAVRVIEEVDSPGPWYAHLKMDIVVKNFKSGKTVLSHSFNRQKQLPIKRVEQMPIAVSRILKEELDTVIEKLDRLQAAPESNQ